MEDILKDENIHSQLRYNNNELTISTEITLKEYKQISSKIKWLISSIKSNTLKFNCYFDPFSYKLSNDKSFQ